MAGIHKTRGEKTFDVFNYIFLGFIAIIMMGPLVYVVLGSFSSTGLIGGFNTFSLEAYRFILTTNKLIGATINSVIITVVGTFVNMFFTTLTAYVLSKKYIIGRDVLMRCVIFFMLFSPGLIPNFLVVDKAGINNTYWAIWLPTAISAYNLVVMKNFFQALPESIEESAKIDGCNDLQVFFSIVLPLSKASLATIALFYAVAHWNQFMLPLLYLNDSDKWPIQILLRQMIILASGAGLGDSGTMEDAYVVPQQSVRMAVIVVSTIPILLVYPFLQKYFTKGIMVGSVKG